MEMSRKEQQIPAIRFNGFTDAWEQRKFSNVVNRVSQQSNDSNLPKVEFEDIVSGEGRLNKDISHKFDSRKGTVFEPEFILYGKLRPYLKNWLFPNFKGIALGDFWVFEPNNSSSIFDYYLIQSDKYQTVANISSGTKMPRSDWKTVSETVFSIPDSINEQEKIGAFFKHLDNTIALHQHHLDNHKELKKALLQKMFPRNGEKLPEVRFGGFTEVWEKRKLNKVMSDFIVPMRDKPKEFSGEIPWTRIEDIEGKYLNDSLSGQYVSQAIIEKMNLKVIPKDSLIVSASATFGVVAIVTQDLITNQTFIGLVPEANFDLDFLYTLFQTPTVRTKMKFESAGSTIFYITRQTFENMQFLLPSYEEQQSIGSFFKNIDDTITLLQQKLNDYQRLKKVMLQQMFV